MTGRRFLAAIAGMLACGAAWAGSPLGLPPVVHPPDNRPSADKIALGRKLFMDPRLSVDGKMACATCHDPLQAFTTADRPTHPGKGGFPLKRNAPTVLNAAFYDALLWSGALPSLEVLAWGPLLNAEEMANPSPAAVVERLGALPDYAGLFEKAFGRPASKETIGKAIAAFERTLISGNSRFDRWWFAGQSEAMTPEEREGFLLFRFKAGCAQCHTLGEDHALFTDRKFHNIGSAGGGDPGRHEVTKKDEDRGAFRTPGLRDVALTAPYMHDGSKATLEEVVEFYDRGGDADPNKVEWIYPLRLSGAEKRVLVAFLKTLTGEMPRQSLFP